MTSTSKKLPKKMHFSCGRYYIVHRNKWIPLSRVEHEALRMYADWMRDYEIGASKIKPIVDEYGKYLDWRVEKGVGILKLASKTRDNYKLIGDRFVKIFVQCPSIRHVTFDHLKEWRERYMFEDKSSMWNLTYSYLKGFFQWCIEHKKKYIKPNENPFTGLRKLPTEPRTRLIQEWEFQAIKENAEPVMKIIMEISDLTSQRIGDVIGITYEDILETHVLIIQQKTGKRLAFVRTEELDKQISAAMEICNVEGATHLFHHTENGGNTEKYQRPAGRELSYGAVYNRWSNAIELYNSKQKNKMIEDIHMHDIRAKGATRADAMGEDAQAILGHDSAKNTGIYLRGFQYEEVMPSTKIDVPEHIPLIRKRKRKSEESVS